MEVIGGIVKTVVVIAFLTLFLEILLPSGSLKKYSKFVMGLLVLVTVINPLLRVFSEALPAVSIEDLEWDGATQAATQQIIDEGGKLEKDLETQGESYYKQSLAKQIKAIVKLVDDVEDALVEVVLNEEQGLSEVTVVLTISSSRAANTTVEGQPEFSEETIRKIRKQVEAAVGDFYDLPADKIQVSISSLAD